MQAWQYETFVIMCTQITESTLAGCIICPHNVAAIRSADIQGAIIAMRMIILSHMHLKHSNS
jgi:hypothetical protein